MLLAKSLVEELKWTGPLRRWAPQLCCPAVKQMPQSTFRTLDPNRDEELLQDVSSLMVLASETQGVILDRLPDLIVAQTARERKQLEQTILDVAKDRGADVSGALRFLRHVAKHAFLDTESPEDPQGLAAQLVAQGFVADSQKEALEALIRRVRDGVLPLRETIRKKTAAQGVFPSLKGIGRTIEVRMVPATSFDEAATPAGTQTVAGHVGIVSVRLETDDDEAFCFQVSREELKLLIAALSRCQSELDEFEGYISTRAPKSGPR